MKNLFYLLLFFPGLIWAQDKKNAEFDIDIASVEMKLRFLASDELQGRYTGSGENRIAARYIAEHLRAFGFQPAPGQSSYFQTINFRKNKTPDQGMLSVGASTYNHQDDLLIISGNLSETSAEAVFAKHGWIDDESGRNDYEGLDVKGKIVFVLPGTADGETPQQIFGAARKKRAIAVEKGAIALIELYRINFIWSFFKQNFSSSSMRLPTPEEEMEAGANQDIIYAWLKEKPEDEPLKAILQGNPGKVTLMSSGYKSEILPSHNVVGVIEGADEKLKEEYVILSAHYDHIGTGRQGRAAYTKEDSIFNGARDNAMGVVALLTAAEALSKDRPKRSIIILACTAEEIGLLGSRYYSENPLIPLNKTIYNVNTDGAGYNTTSEISVLGWGRTGVDDAVTKGTEVFGLGIIKDPAKAQNLFDRSDNLSFTRKGVPAMTISPGFTDFNQEIFKMYHQVIDEANTVDFEYLLKYAQTFTHITRLIADKEQRPQWVKGDKYEEVGKKLYKE